MFKIYSFISLLLVGICVFSACDAQDTAALENTAQLEINKTTLLSPTSAESMRVNAAVLLLLNKDEQARDVLLNVLADPNNPPARIAVCKAIRQSSTWDESVKKDNGFADSLENLLGSSNDDEAKTAAEAMLAYNYSYIGPKIQKIIANNQEPIKKRLNAVQALRIRPDKDAILDLISLVDSPEKQISDMAEKSLQKILGIPVGLDKNEWKRISKELSRKSKDEFVADQLVIQYDKAQKLEAELSSWKSMFLVTIDRYYERSQDETLKIQFALEQFTSDKPELRLWAINKVVEWKSNGNVIPDEVGSKLIGLIGDSNPQIRLVVAQLLVGLSKLNPAEKLLAQINIEKDSRVRLEQFRALGEAVYYATSPGASIQADPNTRLKALEIAGQYLESTAPEESGTGARQMRKLLENKGLNAEIYTKYLTQIADRFARTDSGNDAVLRADLVDSMGRLCGESSICRLEAIKLYKDTFATGLADGNPSVRQFSLAGIINTDGAAAAMSQVRAKVMYDDSNAGIKADILALTEKAGTEEDLVWLVNKVNSNGTSEAVWKTITVVLEKSSAAKTSEFYKEFKVLPTSKPQQFEQVLLILEQKAIAENNNEIKAFAYEELCLYYAKLGEKVKAAKYFKDFTALSANPDKKVEVTTKYFALSLDSGDFEAVKTIFVNKLASSDIQDGDSFIVNIDKFLADIAKEQTIRTKLIEILSSIEAKDKPNWSKKITGWQGAVKISTDGSANTPPPAEPNSVG